MKLQTIIPVQPADILLDYHSKSLLLGSCFSENIGHKLDYFKFHTLQNPFGILFHPLAIENLLERAISGKIYGEKEIFEQTEVWSCFDAHSQLNANTSDRILESLNHGLEQITLFLKEATHVFITLGTAWVYQHESRELAVANCHKVPQKEFKKKLLSIEEVVRSLEGILHLLQSVSNGIQVIFTVSPVRHLKDGFVENQRSKAHLISAIHQLPKKDINYFPSYEIMMDELRDYRFYNADMIHPNELAIDYIWNKFKATWISEEVYEVMDKVETVQKGLAHRPFNANSTAHKAFSERLQAKIEYLQGNYPTINFNR
ncbi:MAG: GSCFA domain-containing protein [Bacteroidota bacterium]